MRSCWSSLRLRTAQAAEDTLAAEAAFEVLVARHGPMVLGVCRRALADPPTLKTHFSNIPRAGAQGGSVRVGDSLGRWLYGVSRRVAAKARARSMRARRRTSSLEFEPAAPEQRHRSGRIVRGPRRRSEPAAREVSGAGRPVPSRGALSHAEAAARLSWPVGTVSGRLSRARGLLKDRLVRRGLAPDAGSLGALSALDEARAALPEQLAASTARAAVRASMGGARAGRLGTSALTLVSEVLRTAVAAKLKAAVAVLLALAVVGTAAAHLVVGAQSTAQPAESAAGTKAGWRRPSTGPPPRPADEIVKEIETLLKTVHRPSSQIGFHRNSHADRRTSGRALDGIIPRTRASRFTSPSAGSRSRF